MARLQLAGAGKQSDRAGTPQRRGRVQAAHVDAFLPNHPGAKKAYAGNDLRGDPRRTRIGELALEHDENRGAKRDQRVGPQSGEALAPLPLEANGAAKQDGDDQVERVVRERGIEYRRHRFFFNSERFARRSHPGENAPAWQKIGRVKPVLAGGGRDLAFRASSLSTSD